METPSDVERAQALRELVRSLTRELFQTETSAVRHCRREAERLTHSPAAATLREIAEQAAGVLRELPPLAKAHGLPESAGGALFGALLSETRDKLLDRLIRSERSYRGTLLGVHHGVDLVQLFRSSARAADLTEVCAFCERWLMARRPLLSRLQEDLAWFAREPAQAMRFARPLLSSSRQPRRSRAPSRAVG